MTGTGAAAGGGAAAGNISASLARSCSRMTIRCCRPRASSNLNADMALSCRTASLESSRSIAASRALYLDSVIIGRRWHTNPVGRRVTLRAMLATHEMSTKAILFSMPKSLVGLQS
jgi:hypothetical protein